MSRSALVTGAAQGIGAAIAMGLARKGFNIGLADLAFQEAQANKVIEQIKSKNSDVKCVFIPCDVSKREQVFNAVKETEAQLGSFDVIVSNAGVAPVKPILDYTELESLKIWSINVNGVLWGIQAASESFIRNKHPRGKIINACSIAGFNELSFLALYGASKFAVRSLTLTLAKELAKHNIRVNAFCPGIVDTPMWDQIDATICKETGLARGVPTKGYTDNIALGRMEKPEDIVGLVNFLAGEDSDYMTGQSIIVDGGMIAA